MGTREWAAHGRGARGWYRPRQGIPPEAGRPALEALGVVAGVTYDTGALVAAERNDRQMWALHAGYVRLGVVPIVPAPVLAQAWRGGGRQAALSRFLAVCEVEPLTEEQARVVGILCGRAAHDDVIDATVVEGAVRRDDTVVTSNEADIRGIAEVVRATLQIEVI